MSNLFSYHLGPMSNARFAPRKMKAFAVCLIAFLPAVALGCSTAELEYPRRVGPGDFDRDAAALDGAAADARADSTDASIDGDIPGYPRGTTNARVIVQPGDGGAELLSAVQGAASKVHVTMYLLTSGTFINAFIAQKNAGREVKVILNRNFPEGGNPNQAAYEKLAQAGVDVVYGPPAFTYTHEKCLIIDTKSAWVMTMNLTATLSAREYLVVDSDPDDVAEAESIFQADFVNASPAVSGKLVVAPVNAYDRLKELAGAAKSTLDVEAQVWSDETMTNALVAAKNRGVNVRVVLSDETPSSAGNAAAARLKGAAIPVVKVGTPYIHAKTMVADGVRAYVGSENFTRNSLSNNRELGVILADPAEVAKVSSTIASDFAMGAPL